MKSQAEWSAGRPAIEDEILGMEADTAAYSGKLRAADELSRRAIDIANRAGEKESAETYAVLARLRRAIFEIPNENKAARVSAVMQDAGRDVEYGFALASAYDQYVSPAQLLMSDLEKKYPEDTMVQFNYLPTLRGVIALNKGNFSEGLEALKIAASYELGQSTSSVYGWTALHPVFVRGRAYLAAHQGKEAAAEFQKILDNSGIVVNDPIGALARLGLARAYVLQGDTAKARAAYQGFFGLWKNADPDIPILIAAQSEYAKLK